jgi:hypothetical protein
VGLLGGRGALVGFRPEPLAPFAIGHDRAVFLERARALEVGPVRPDQRVAVEVGGAHGQEERGERVGEADPERAANDACEAARRGIEDRHHRSNVAVGGAHRRDQDQAADAERALGLGELGRGHGDPRLVDHQIDLERGVDSLAEAAHQGILALRARRPRHVDVGAHDPVVVDVRWHEDLVEIPLVHVDEVGHVDDVLRGEEQVGVGQGAAPVGDRARPAGPLEGVERHGPGGARAVRTVPEEDAGRRLAGDPGRRAEGAIATLGVQATSDALACSVEGEAVKGAADTPVLDRAAVAEVGPEVRTDRVEHGDRAAGVAEGHQLLAHELERGDAPGGDLVGAQDGEPAGGELRR